MCKELSAISLFAGCGGSDLGLRRAGIEVIWANEKNRTACDLYEQVVGSSPIEQADIRSIGEFPAADILAGCYPCQGYSQAGRRNNGDGINYLYRDFDRVLRQVKPLAFIVENVNGMRFSHNRHLLRNQLVRFRSAGYRVTWEILNAKDYGLAQERKRLFMVGIRSSERVRYSFPRPSHGVKAASFVTLRDIIGDLGDAPAGSYNDEPLHWYYLSRNRRRGWNEQAPCIVANWRHVGLHPSSPPLRRLGPDRWEFTKEGQPRRYSYLECAAIQGFPRPEDFRAGSVEQRFRAIGNAVPPPLFGAVASQLVKLLQSRGSSV